MRLPLSWLLVSSTLVACTPLLSTNTGSAPQSALARAIATADSLVSASVGTLVPGAVLVVARDGRIIHERAFGFAELNDASMRRLASPRPMTTQTIFDVASVTKVMATTFAVMLLVDRGQVELDAPVHRYLIDFRGPHLDSIAVRHLLQHSSGLLQWQPLYYQASSKSETYGAIRDMLLGWGVGEARHYSDLGFMLLGYIVETVSGQSLDQFLELELYRPLGLRSTVFNPKRRGLTGFAATESGNGYERRMVYDTAFGYRYSGDPRAWNRWRSYVLIGETNDGNAWYANSGVAGHAGLFSTARELQVLLDLILNRGTRHGRVYLRPETIERFLTVDRYGHYLGWQVPSGLPAGSFAHGGFTGTYVVGIPRYNLGIVLLTNRQNLGVNDRGFFPNIDALRAVVARTIVQGAAAEAPTASATTDFDSGGFVASLQPIPVIHCTSAAVGRLPDKRLAHAAPNRPTPTPAPPPPCGRQEAPIS